MRGFGVVCWLLLVSFRAPAQTPDLPPRLPAHTHQADLKTDATPGPHPLEASDLEPFFDGIVPLQLERSDVAGASVLVMQNGQVLLEKGYGYADLKSKKPVDPANTIFRLASISKLFTWVSVMQLAEQGKLDLDTDVNRYLDFPIRPAFSHPITLRNLIRTRKPRHYCYQSEAADKLARLSHPQPANQDVRSWDGSGVLELRGGTGRLHRAAGERAAL